MHDIYRPLQVRLGRPIRRLPVPGLPITNDCLLPVRVWTLDAGIAVPLWHNSFTQGPE